MKQNLNILKLFFVFFGIAFGINAQNKQLQAFTLEDGLPQSQVYAMTQDAKGYLWLGTQGGGLARFDGKSFKIYNETNGLASNYIHALKSESDTLYIGTKLGLSILVNTRFITIETPQVHKITKINNQLLALTKEGIYEISEGFSVEKIKLQQEIDNTYVKDLIYFDDFYWIATQSGLFKLSALKDSASTIKKLQHNDFTALVGYKNNLYASTFNDGTLVFESNNFENAVLIKEPLRINSTSIQNNNQLWIATDNDGIFVIDTDTNAEIFSIHNKNGLSVSRVMQVLKDQQLNIWIATSGGGLYKYFQNNFKHFNTETGLNGNRIYAVHHTNNAIWISNSEAGLMRIDDFGIHDIKTPDLFSEVKIKTITSDKQGSIWAGSDGRGILFRGKTTRDSVVVDTLTNTKTVTPLEIEKIKILSTENGFPFDWIRKLYTQNDTIFAATYSSGIVAFNYNAKTDRLSVYNTFSTSNGIEDLYIKDMVMDDKNRLWYATQNGHLGYLKNNEIVHFGAVLNQKVAINTILFKENTMFLGTAGKGIWWSNGENFSTFKKLEGAKTMASENIYQLIFDNQNYLWVGTERGVDKLELNKDNTITDAFFFGRNDGFLGIETCLNAVDKDKDGHLWFGALYGLTEYRPTTTSQDAQKPTLFLEDVRVDYKSLDSLKLSIWTNSEKVLHLKPEQRQVGFSFKTVDLDHPNGVEYRYKLNDNDWSPWSIIETQDLQELNFGAHNFVVQSRNYRWQESDPLRFSFFIDRPFYKKVWFQWLVTGVAILVLAVWIRRYVKRLKLKNKQEKERLKLENHLLTLEQKALRLQMNPHFIFNVLNGIKAMAPAKPEKMNDTVNSFATLLRETLINSRKDTIGLDQEIKTLRHYIEVEQLMAEETFKYDIKVQTDLDPEEILIPPMLIQPFVENAVRHGILKGPRSGELNIVFETINDFLKVSITDNGIGIYHSQQQKPKTDHQSMALTVTKERLESISGKNALEIVELKDKDENISGTKVVFKIPLETDF